MSICPYEGDWSWRRCSSCWRCFPTREKEQDLESSFYLLSSLAVLHTEISWLEASEHRTLETVFKCQPVWPTQTRNCGEWIWGPVGPRLAQGSCVGWVCQQDWRTVPYFKAGTKSWGPLLNGTRHQGLSTEAEPCEPQGKTHVSLLGTDGCSFLPLNEASGLGL